MKRADKGRVMRLAKKAAQAAISIVYALIGLVLIAREWRT